MFGRTQGLLAATLGLAAWGACATPDELSDLRPAGDPEVLTVLVADKGPDPDNDGIIANGEADVTETATFCKPNDNKRPNFVNYPLALGGTQLCPDDIAMGVDPITDAEPLEWYVRIQFDELLNPSIEDLIPILDDNGIATGTFSGTLANTQPVTLTCNGAAVMYDGYYAPEGNDLTWPVGPSLFIQPNDSSTIATGSPCEIAIKDVVKDKDGNSVPTDQRGGGGKYKFNVAPLTVTATSQEFPKDPTDPDPQPVDAPLQVGFNAIVDGATSIPATAVIIQTADDCNGTNAVTTLTATVAADPDDPTLIDVGDSAAAAGNFFVAGKIYIVTFDPAATVHDANGGTGALPDPADLTVCFGT